MDVNSAHDMHPHSVGACTHLPDGPNAGQRLAWAPLLRGAWLPRPARGPGMFMQMHEWASLWQAG